MIIAKRCAQPRFSAAVTDGSFVVCLTNGHQNPCVMYIFSHTLSGRSYHIQNFI
jgi:hypothetical protein